jgi:hypothetical protein
MPAVVMDRSTSDRSLLRIAAVAVPIGIVLEIGMEALHPSKPDPNDSAAAFHSRSMPPRISGLRPTSANFSSHCWSPFGPDRHGEVDVDEVRTHGVIRGPESGHARAASITWRRWRVRRCAFLRPGISGWSIKYVPGQWARVLLEGRAKGDWGATSTWVCRVAWAASRSARYEASSATNPSSAERA